jgi:hypothetical protein
LATARGRASAANRIIGIWLERPTRTAAPVLCQEYKLEEASETGAEEERWWLSSLPAVSRSRRGHGCGPAEGAGCGRGSGHGAGAPKSTSLPGASLANTEEDRGVG